MNLQSICRRRPDVGGITGSRAAPFSLATAIQTVELTGNAILMRELSKTPPRIRGWHGYLQPLATARHDVLHRVCAHPGKRSRDC